MDALFGLPRKKAAGKSFRDPLHRSLFFGDQCTVDEHVAAHKAHGKTIPKVMLSDDVLDEHYGLLNITSQLALHAVKPALYEVKSLVSLFL